MGKRLDNKVAIVTGASSGIGEAISLLFAREGARVFLVDLQEEKGKVVRDRIAAEGGECAFLRVDLAESEGVTRVVPAAVGAFGGVDVLVNNAAFYGIANKKSVVDTPPEVWQRTLQVNLTCPYLLSRDAIPSMVERGGGAIVNVASIGGVEAFPHFAAYSVSKAALIQLTKSIAVDFGAGKIRANAICPGAIDTPGNDPFVENREDYERLIKSLTPLEQIGKPIEVAWAALYLASDESRYVTGTTLVVDGGRLAKA